MTNHQPIKKIIIISLLIILVSAAIYLCQRAAQNAIYRHSTIDVIVHTYDPGLQPTNIEEIYKLPEKKWQAHHTKAYNNLYVEQTLWDRVYLYNGTASDKTIVISELGNYVKSQIIYSDLSTNPVTTRFSKEHFKQRLTLPAKTQTTIYIEKTGFLLNNNSTKILEYDAYRLDQLLGLISSTCAYGTLLGIGVFYLINIQSRQTHLSERLAIMGYLALMLLVIASENNFHSLIETDLPNAGSIGKKIALPLLLIPISSYLLLRTYNIASNSHPLQRLSIIFFISSLLLAYCLINSRNVPFIYLTFTALAFIHQFCWLYHIGKSQQLNSIGQTASISFVLAGVANHTLVIFLIAFPELTNARLHIINTYYLICISSAIVMLNDKNIIQFIKSQHEQQTQQRINLRNNHHRETQRISKNIDQLLTQVQNTLTPSLPEIAKVINNLRLLQMEASWRRQFINQQAFNELHYKNYARKNIQKQPTGKAVKQRFGSFNAIENTESNNSSILADNTLELEPSISNSTLIIIDDNSTAAVTTAKAIQEKAYRIEIFTNPLHALSYITIKASASTSGDDIVAVITDYNMPEINGKELLSQIMNRYSHIEKKPKLIIFSSMSRHINADDNIAIIDKTNTKNLQSIISHA